MKIYGLLITWFFTSFTTYLIIRYYYNKNEK